MKAELIQYAPTVKNAAGRTICLRSEEYMDRISDLRIDFDAKVFRANVSNEKGKTYHVKWDLTNRKVSCTCPAHGHRMTLPCKHAVAVYRTMYHAFKD
jgi:uncharacterized Zn finger protein